MAIPYTIIQRVNPANPTAPRKHYGVAKSNGEVSLRQLADQIAVISTVSSIDTLAVLESLLQVLPNHLLQGRIVRLGDFGDFRITISTERADTAENFHKSMIKKANLNFRGGKLIRNALKTADFVKV